MMTRESSAKMVRLRTVALVGNPNSGKTTLFNQLTGLRQKIGNYPGVTVERKEGTLQLKGGETVHLLDLPGTYSLSAASTDERITTDVLFGRFGDVPRPDLVVCVVDASNLERNLYLVSQLIDQELPLIVALNMYDVARAEGTRVNQRALETELGVPVIPTCASRGEGIAELREAIAASVEPSVKARQWGLPEKVAQEWEELAGLLQEHQKMTRPVALHEALDLLTHPEPTREDLAKLLPPVLEHLRKDHQKLDFLGFNRPTMDVDARYGWIQSILGRAVSRSPRTTASLSDRIDWIVTHRIWGFVIFLALMALMFQSVFSWAEIPMNLISSAFDEAGQWLVSVISPGDLRDLLLDGALAGVASVVLFLPQILLLFLFLGLLEDTGYMARAAFIMDRLMTRVGLHGKSFIPLLSSFACAIPGIMATRTIENSRDRLATMLVAPLMSCSARLPVYALLIAAAIPPVSVLGFLSLPALTLFAMYTLGVVAAVVVAWVFKKAVLRRSPPVFLMEMPPYRLPSVRTILLHMGDRAWVFLKRAGTIILGASIILWFLATYPRLENGTSSERLQYSFAGRAGRLIEPWIAPLGFDWKIGIGLISSLLQREMFVSTMGTIYNVQDGAGEGTVSLTRHMQSDVNPATGRKLFTPLTGVCLMIYYVLAMQCLSTVAVMRRETNGWKWPLIQIGYMTGLAYSVTFAVYQLGLWLEVGL